MKILLTAFKGEHNSSFQLIKDSNHNKLLFTNSFSGIDKDAENIDFIGYDCAVMFGLDTKLRDSIRIESMAKVEEHTLSTALDISALSISLDKNGIKNITSNKPTAYLCNYAYYRILKKMNGRAVFLHVPPKRYITEEFKGNVLSALKDMYLK